MSNLANHNFTFFVTEVVSPFLKRDCDGELEFVTSSEIKEINISHIDEITVGEIEYEGTEYSCTKIVFADESSMLVLEDIPEIQDAYKKLALSLREMISAMDEMNDEDEESEDDEELEEEDEIQVG
jgi:hypothetical protein